MALIQIPQMNDTFHIQFPRRAFPRESHEKHFACHRLPLPCCLFKWLSSLAQVRESTSMPIANHPVAAIQDTEQPLGRDARMAWWARGPIRHVHPLGALFHPPGTWNRPASPRHREWIMNRDPSLSRLQGAASSQSTEFNAHDIVALAKLPA